MKAYDQKRKVWTSGFCLIFFLFETKLLTDHRRHQAHFIKTGYLAAQRSALWWVFIQTGSETLESGLTGRRISSVLLACSVTMSSTSPYLHLAARTDESFRNATKPSTCPLETRVWGKKKKKNRHQPKRSTALQGWHTAGNVTPLKSCSRHTLFNLCNPPRNVQGALTSARSEPSDTNYHHPPIHPDPLRPANAGNWVHGIDQSIIVKDLNDSPSTLNNADISPTHLACRTRDCIWDGTNGGVGVYESQSPIAWLQTQCGSDYGP